MQQQTSPPPLGLTVCASRYLSANDWLKLHSTLACSNSYHRNFQKFGAAMHEVGEFGHDDGCSCVAAFQATFLGQWNPITYLRRQFLSGKSEALNP
jgi:hypothetical protein